MLQGQQSPLRLERGLRGGNVLRDELGGLWGQVRGWQQPGRLGSHGSSVGKPPHLSRVPHGLTWGSVRSLSCGGQTGRRRGQLEPSEEGGVSFR